jgi:hypothetical protein
MKSFTELREQQELDESWRTLGAGLLVLRRKGISRKIKNIKYKRGNTVEENVSDLFAKIDLLAEQNNSVGYLTGQLGVVKDEK